MSKRSNIDHGLLLLVVGLFGWIVPGGGYFVIKERKRAIIVFVTITATFLVGLYVGSIGVIDSVGSWPWYIAQIMTSPTVGMLARLTKTAGYTSYGKPNEIGQIYTSIAGMLNLLCIISSVYMAYCGRGEIIGEEENAK